LQHLWFDVTYRGTRFRVPVNEFAIPRMDLNKQRPIASLEEARDWERVFIGNPVSNSRAVLTIHAQ
jgi:hypothetical protein